MPFRFRLVSLVCLSFAFLLPAGPRVLAQSKAEQIDALLTKYHELRQFNGSVLVAEHGEVIYKKGFGYANMPWDVPNTPDTKFRIGSVTKQFTAALILKLVEQGKLDLQGTITDYLPDYPKAQGERVTIHHLLTHTSGIPSYTGLPGFMRDNARNPYEPDSLTAVFAHLPLEFEPGSEWRYNNSGYILLGVIIEKITGQPYDEVLRTWILDPLGLDDTGYEHNADVIERAASGYVRTIDGYANAPYLDTSVPYAAGMMYSTVEDLYAWDQALYTDRLFDDPKTKELMFTPYMQDYGYGWFVAEKEYGGAPRTVVEHGGGIFGFITAFTRLVDDRHLVVVLDNTSGQKTGEIKDNLVRILYGEAPEAPVASIADVLREVGDEQGIAAAVARYRELKAAQPEAYDFGEDELNQLGYYYLGKGDTDAAIAIFQLNVEAFPEAANPYDSLGEAYMEAGDHERAVANYRKSLELNPGNENAKVMLRRMGVEVAEDEGEVQLPPDVLDRYVGRYELAPDFILTITREGSQLKGQATGQPQVDLFASSENTFFLKVVNARITFDVTAGRAESLTLYQNGRQIPGKRIE